LIACSACLKGKIPYLLQRGRHEEARADALALASIFDNDRFYLEVQANGLPEQLRVNVLLEEMGKDLSLPLIATNDCHYLKREDAEAHDALLCIQTGKTVDDPKRLKFSKDEFFFKSGEEMATAFPGNDWEEAFKHTLEVARRCRFEMEFGRYKYPSSPPRQEKQEVWMRCSPRMRGKVLKHG